MNTKGKKEETFADRFLQLKGDESYQLLSDRMAKAGIAITAAGLHKWAAGGGITPENLTRVATFFGVSPAELFFGEETRQAEDLDSTTALLVQALTRVPARFRKEIDRDILTLARAYTDRTRERNLYDKFDRALQELEKR